MIKANKWTGVNGMRHDEEWSGEDTPGWDEWSDREEDWDDYANREETDEDWEEWDNREQPDEEWEEEFYRIYREYYPEEFEDEDEDATSDEEDDFYQWPSDSTLNYFNQLLNGKKYTDEPIIPRKAPEPLPQPLQAARSLEGGMARRYQNPAQLFLKQAKLLEHYEDDYPHCLNPYLYYPTYARLSNSELRSYFTFRTRVRRGEEPGGCSSFAFLYIYELINGIGVENPREGLEKLDAAVERFCGIDTGIRLYWNQWRQDYLVYYGLPPELNHPSRDDAFARLDEADTMDTQEIIDTLKTADAINSWLNRSKCYAAHREEFDRVLADTVRGISRRCSGKTRSFCDRYFGILHEEPTRLFSTAVFADPLKRKTADYVFSPWHTYRLEGGVWMRRRRYATESGIRKLTGLVKSVDNVLRAHFDPKHLIQAPEQQKWVNTLMAESLQAILDEQEAQRREQQRLKIDYSALERIRTDAAITREKLRVAEEMDEFPQELPERTPVQPTQPAALAEDASDPASESCPLNRAEYRLMKCLLYGSDTGWVQQEGMMESVLLDGINEKLYDIFQDSVVEDAGIIEDYIDELKEMIAP